MFKITKVAAVVFLLIALLQLLRAVLGWEAKVNNWSAPIWLSLVAVLIAGTLSYLLFKED